MRWAAYCLTMTTLVGARVTLRPAESRDIEALVRIRSTPEVFARWRGDDIEGDLRTALGDDDDRNLYVIEDNSEVVIGAIQWAANEDPEYAHASVDLFVDPRCHGQGLGTDAARTVCAHLIHVVGFHRLVIDPAADNAAAIRCYEKVGFRRVGTMREYERATDGTFHDGLLMDLLAGELQ